MRINAGGCFACVALLVVFMIITNERSAGAMAIVITALPAMFRTDTKQGRSGETS